MSLSRTEWLLLQVLAINANHVVLHSELLTEVWGPEFRDDLQYLRVWVSRVRRKLGAAPARPARSPPSRASATSSTPTRGGVAAGAARRAAANRPGSSPIGVEAVEAGELQPPIAGTAPRRNGAAPDDGRPRTTDPHDPDALDRREPGEGRLGALIDVAPVGAEPS